MMKIEFDGHKIEVPTSWSEITLGDYEKWQNRKAENKLDYIHYIADICGLEADTLLSAPADVFETISQQMQFIFDADHEPHYVVEIGKEKYFVSSSDKLTLGEWVDVDAILNSEDNKHQLSEILAIVCRPVAEKYNTELSQERAKLFRSQPCDKMLPLVSFFLHRDKQLKETLNHCSQVVAEANRFLKDTKTFAASGDGIKRLPIL